MTVQRVGCYNLGETGEVGAIDPPGPETEPGTARRPARPIPENGKNIGGGTSVKKLSFLQKVTYGLGDFGSQFAYFIVNTYFMIFMTNFMGIPAATAGAIYMIVMVFDAINDPIIGNMADRTRKTKMGKYRKWTVFASFPYAIAMWLSFLNPNAGPGGQVAWALIIHLIYTICATAWQVPYGSLPNRMTTDANERVALGTFRDWFANLAKFAIGYVGVWLISAFSKDAANPDSGGYFGMAGICAIVCIAFTLIAGLTSREVVDVGEDAPDSERVTLWQGIKSVFTNGPAMIIMVVAFLATVALNFKSAITPYYAQYCLGNPALTGTILPLIFTMPLVFQFFVPVLSKKLGVKAMFIISMICAGLSGVTAMMGSSMPMIIISALFMSVMCAFFSPVLWGVLPTLTDYGEWKNGVAAPGSYYALMSFFIKVSTGLAGLLISWSLTLGGFDAAKAEQTEATIRSIFVWNGVVPIVCAVIGVALMFFYNMKQETLDEMQEELAQRRAAKIAGRAE